MDLTRNKSYLHNACSFCVGFSLVAIVLVCLHCAATTSSGYVNDPDNELKNRNAKAVYVPVTHIHTSYSDNTAASVDTRYSDSFLVETVNTYAHFIAAQRFGLVEAKVAGNDSAAKETPPTYSYPASGSIDSAAVPEQVRQIALETGAQLVIVPDSCEINYTLYKPAGWRGGKYDDTYGRPQKCMAHSKFRVRIWNKNGLLLCERTGISDNDKPFLYSLFKKEKPSGDLVAFAKRLYAPPIIKSLYRSVENALK